MQDISNETRVQLEKRYRTTGIIYLAQISSAVFLVIIGYVFVGKSEKTFDPTLTMALWAAILFIAVGTFLLRRKLYRWERLKDLTLLNGDYFGSDGGSDYHNRLRNRNINRRSD
jgi:O-antigen/teichoic acid export membrane protein